MKIVSVNITKNQHQLGIESLIKMIIFRIVDNNTEKDPINLYRYLLIYVKNKDRF